MEGHEGPAVRVIARGDVWVTVECLVGWQHTRAAIRHTFYAELPYLDVETQLYMQARRKMLKLQIPFHLPNCKAVCEVPYGVTERPTDATEYPYARWVRLENDGFALGVANNGQNGFDVDANGVLNLSVTRGGTHCAWSETDVPTEKSYTFMDQSRIDTKFRIVAGENTAADLVLAAQELNHPLERFFAYFPASLPPEAPANPAPFLTVTPATVVVGALKKAETEDALVVRLQETVGERVSATVQLENAAPLTVTFTPYQIQTFKINRSGEWIPCNLLEEEVNHAG